jgi:hypothetical protein
MRKNNGNQVWERLRYGPAPINKTAQNVGKQKPSPTDATKIDKNWCPICKASFSTSFEKHRKSELHLGNRMQKQGYKWEIGKGPVKKI